MIYNIQFAKSICTNRWESCEY